MNKLMIIAMISISLMLSTISAYALTIDTKLYGETLDNSGYNDELLWVNTWLLDNSEIDIAFDTMIKTETEDGAGWVGDGDIYSYTFADFREPAYFYVKVGVPNGLIDTITTHYIYKNIGELDMAVVSASQFNVLNEPDFSMEIGRLSHFGELGSAPVPEPATMLLFGAGLAGLAGTRLRRKKI